MGEKERAALAQPAGGGAAEPTGTVVVTFATTTDALALQAAAGPLGLAGRLAPVPRQLSASCGLAWHEPRACEASLRALVTAHGLRYESLHTLDR